MNNIRLVVADDNFVASIFQLLYFLSNFGGVTAQIQTEVHILKISLQ